MTVYIEPFIFMNFIMNFTLLVLCQKCAGLSVRMLRTFSGAVAGCIYSLISCIYEYTWLAGVPARLICAALMTANILPGTELKLYLRLLISFAICTFLLGGTGFSLLFMLGRGGFSLSSALISCIIGCTSIYFILRRKKSLLKSNSQTRLIIECNSFTFDMRALIDSGNLLTEPISALPVIVCTDPAFSHSLKNSGRTLPYRGAGGEGMYTLYKADALYIWENGKKTRIQDAYIAFDASFCGHFDFDLIVPSSMFI